MAASYTTDLRDTLAEPVESGFVESTFQSPDDFVGYFDASSFANWIGDTASGRDYIRNELVSNGFVTGYQRLWTMRNSSDTLYETVFVFKTGGGAHALLSTHRGDMADSTYFKGWLPFQVNDTAFAVQQIDTDGFHWTFAAFAKGNDVFELFRGSQSDYQTTAALSQAREMYSTAPNGTQLGPPQSSSRESAVVQFRTPLIITFVAGALLIAIALVIAAVSAITARPAQAIPRP